MNKRVSQIKQSVKNEVIGISAIGLACLGIVAIYSARSGLIGEKVKSALTILAGGGRLFILLIIGAWGFTFMSNRQFQLRWRAGGIFLLLISLLGFIHLQLPGIDAFTQADIIAEGRKGHGGGVLGAAIVLALKTAVGISGSYVILIMITIIGALLVTNSSLVGGVREVKRLGEQTGSWVKNQVTDFVFVLQEEPNDALKEENVMKSKARKPLVNKKNLKLETNVEKSNNQSTRTTPVIFRTQGGEFVSSDQDIILESQQEVSRVLNHEENIDNQEKIAKPPQILPPGKITGTPISRQTQPNELFQLPSLMLLHKPLKVKNARLNKDLADNVKILEDTLDSFGVKVKVTHVSQGPAITRYEAQPAPGVKVSKITNLADDIALGLAASDVRIEAPVPGKSVVGIEVPNKEISTVHFREVLESQEFENSNSKLSLALGKDITGMPIIADLSKMPHLLIAGATGSGKSVCVNTLINSILFKSRPDEVKFLLVDPKMVELTNYNGIPHLLAPVVTDPKKAAGALKWIVTEMETRYELFAAAGVRDIVRFNFLRQQEKKEDKPPLPYVVVIIDELADLMMVAPADVEDAICRLAQMARAAGIHLIVATQRPSVDVITGLIKANIPSRIAFAVSSQIDSRTIIDMNGAEKLLGRGDMLFYPMGASKPVRVQGCYLADKEVENVTKFLQTQAKPEYQEIPNVISEPVKQEEAEDELFYQAAQLFIESGNASVSYLQRRLRIGYTRAARIVDILEEKGVVGGYEGSKPREVLMTRGQFEQKFGVRQDLKVN